MSGSSIDELMWLIADDGDPGAVEAFIKRHPEHRAELIRRVNMVKSLKGTRPAETKVPAFQMRSAMPSALPNSQPAFWKSGAFAVMLCSILVAAFAVTRMAMSGPSLGEEKVPVVAQENLPTAKEETLIDPNGPNPAGAYPIPSQNPAPVAGKQEKYVVFEAGNYRLYELLNSISVQCGAQFEIAPGLPNDYVDLNQTAMPPKQLLEFLGQKLGFTAFEQGPNDYLIIPAVDPNSTPAPVETPENPERLRPQDAQPGPADTNGESGTTSPKRPLKEGELPAPK